MEFRFLIAGFVVACAAGCGNVNSNQVAADAKQIEELEAAVTQAKKDIMKLQFDTALARTKGDLSVIALMRPGDEGYSVVRYDLGTLIIAIDDISPYANGSKVTLRFGNPLASSVNGLEAKVDWGLTDEEGGMKEETLRSKEVTLNETLRPGAWTKSTIVLDGIPPSSLGFVRLSNVSHTGVQLSR